MHFRGTLSGHIKRGHWEGDVYVIDEFELEELHMTPKEAALWRKATYGAKLASKVTATPDAIAAYRERKTVGEYLADRSKRDGTDMGSHQDNSNSDGADTAL